MAQTNQSGKLGRLKNGVYENYAENLAVATTGAFVNQLDVDCRAVSKANIVIHNDASGDLDFRILANIKPIASIVAPIATDSTNRGNGWIILSAGSVASSAVPTQYKVDETYTKVIVQVKHTTATTNTDIYYRGTRSQ